MEIMKAIALLPPNILCVLGNHLIKIFFRCIFRIGVTADYKIKKNQIYNILLQVEFSYYIKIKINTNIYKRLAKKIVFILK